jgi:arginyl-tRNA synthetase
MKDLAVAIMLERIKVDMKSMNVEFEIYFSEKSLHKDNIIPDKLKEIDGVIVKDGAT